MQRISVSQAILDIKVHDIIKTIKDEVTLRIKCTISCQSMKLISMFCFPEIHLRSGNRRLFAGGFSIAKDKPIQGKV